MCFIGDYDWTAAVVEQQERTAEKPITCMECYRKIQPGKTYRDIYQQEHEECHTCYECECNCPKDADGDCIECCCEKPAFGNTYDYCRCMECDKFLQAIEASELAAGCALSESRPPLGEMTESIQELGADEARRYVQQAAKQFPELVPSGYLGWLWRKKFSWLNRRR